MQASRFLPDPHRITLHAERGASPVHHLDPRTKALALLWVILVVTLARPAWIPVVAWAGSILVYRSADLPLRELAKWSVVPALFVASLVVVLVWGEPGTPLFSSGGLVLTDGGVLLGASLLFRALATVTFSLVVLMSTRYADLARLASTILPSPVDQVLLLSYRFLFSAIELVDELLVAVSSRGGGIARGILTQTRLFAGIFALSFIRAFDRADRVGRAMSSRGYSGQLVHLEPMPALPPVQGVSIAIAFATLACATLTGLGGLFGGGGA